MSFSRSKRFNDKIETTPGPGQYSIIGEFGSDAKKHKIHASPRFHETCKRLIKMNRRMCPECTNVDIATHQSPKEVVNRDTPRHQKVHQNVTFKNKENTVPEYKKALYYFRLFRKVVEAEKTELSQK
ncbi:uncharacterized protein LOC123678188 [Harmonia axyridis]|uniref:uncharacterized protein LOC123678188 n=1 Tax=Harmonia axyridis TaxID=115357 RepID=UPI001E277882|nr:uncharacterized protein LOC123678188 [Harmonia axyridis]